MGLEKKMETNPFFRVYEEDQGQEQEQKPNADYGGEDYGGTDAEPAGDDEV